MRALRIKNISCFIAVLWLNQGMTSFAVFRPSTRTFCHTPFWINANTFYVLNSTSTVLLMEFIVCILLDKTYCTVFYKVLHCQLSHLMMLVLAVCWQLSFMLVRIYVPSTQPSFCQAVLYSSLKFLLTLYNLPCPCKCPSLSHFHTCMHMLV